jgi:hypothetical protein
MMAQSSTSQVSHHFSPCVLVEPSGLSPCSGKPLQLARGKTAVETEEIEEPNILAVLRFIAYIETGLGAIAVVVGFGLQSGEVNWLVVAWGLAGVISAVLLLAFRFGLEKLNEIEHHLRPREGSDAGASVPPHD